MTLCYFYYPSGELRHQHFALSTLDKCRPALLGTRRYHHHWRVCSAESWFKTKVMVEAVEVYWLISKCQSHKRNHSTLTGIQLWSSKAEKQHPPILHSLVWHLDTHTQSVCFYYTIQCNAILYYNNKLHYTTPHHIPYFTIPYDTILYCSALLPR